MLNWFEKTAPIRVKFKALLVVHALLAAVGVATTWLAGGSLVLMAAGLGFGIVLAMRASRAEALAGRAQELEEARDRADLLARELNHRVKNLFAVIRSLVKLSAMGQDDVPLLVRELDQRIAALAAAHTVSLGCESTDGGPLGEILGAVLSPYPAEGSALSIDGPPVDLPQSKITPMGLILNELATNALKYGAWSTREGRVAVTWSLTREAGATRILLVWKEHSPGFSVPDAAPPRRGFGTDLVEMSSAQLQSVMTRAIEPDGIRITLEFEIEPAASVAPQRSAHPQPTKRTVFA